MNLNRRHLLVIMLIILLSLSAFSALHILPLNLFSIQQKPTPQPQKLYDYYTIIDEVDGHSLMYVPLVVNVGDEVLTEENKRYKIVKVEQNRAFARFIENVNLDKYK